MYYALYVLFLHSVEVNKINNMARNINLHQRRIIHMMAITLYIYVLDRTRC